MTLPMPQRSLSRLCLLAPLLLLGLVSCQTEHTYSSKGRIAGFSDDGRTVFIEHVDIPGLMPAMTMPFTASPPAMLDSLTLRQAVAFKLTITLDSAWVHDLTPLPDDALPAYPAARPTDLTPVPNDRFLDLGDPVPAVTFTDQEGRTRSLQDFEGQSLLITFIYTRCPLPDYCPLVSRHFQALRPHLESFTPPVHLLSLSFDPANDTPDVLKAYGARYTDDFTGWTFGVPDEGQVQQLSEAFRVFAQVGADGEWVHNLSTTLVGADGRLLAQWQGNAWTPDDVLGALRKRAAAP